MLGKQRLVHILAPVLPFCRPCPPFRPCPAAAACATSMSAACHTVPDGSNTMFHAPLHSCGETLYYAPQLRMARSLVDHPTTCCQVMGVPGQQVRMQCAMLIYQTTQIEMCLLRLLCGVDGLRSSHDGIVQVLSGGHVQQGSSFRAARPSGIQHLLVQKLLDCHTTCGKAAARQIHRRVHIWQVQAAHTHFIRQDTRTIMLLQLVSPPSVCCPFVIAQGCRSGLWHTSTVHVTTQRALAEVYVIASCARAAA